MKKLKIGVIQRFLPPASRGGVGYFTHGLCNTLVDRGHSVTVFSQDPAPADARYRVTLVPTPIGRGHLFWAVFSFPFQIRRLNFSSFDIIHAQGDDHLINRKGIPFVRTMHDSSLAMAIHYGIRFYSIKRFLMFLYFYFESLISDIRADRVTAVSPGACYYYPKIHAVIPNGVDLEQFRASKAKKSPIPTILFVGHIYSGKRGHLLLTVARKEILSRLPNAELWLVCPEKVEGRGIRWFGQVGPSVLAELYRQAWVFCLPSSYEPFGRCYVEAMAAGTPVVATMNPGSREILQNGRCGLLVSDDQLGSALYALLTRQELRQEYSRLGLIRAEEYSWDKVIVLYERIYREAIQEKRQRNNGL